MFGTLIILSALSTAVAFNAAVKPATRTTMALNAKSKSLPFMDQPAYLDGSMPGDVGFDPLGLGNGDKEKNAFAWAAKEDWSKQIVPKMWLEGGSVPISQIEWMREAELKHGRMSMMAVLGWVAVDSGLRFPGEMFANIPNSLAAHDAAVQNGSMAVLLNIVAILELCTGAAIFDQAKGSGRTAGDFSFDPLNLGKNEANLKRYKENEIANGRLAMLAFSGIVTAAALFPDRSFPYF